MISRLSQLFVRTLREDPVDAEVTSHKLMVRAGYIRRQAPGVFAWLPLGLAVKRKLEKVIHEEMAAAGAQEIHFPALLPREPYEATGRWEEYGDNLFRLKDRKEADYLLAPTHEEVFTLTVKDLYTSYKDLPLTLYQIQDKYRDEARPRAGILRGREFTMKDAYSFDIDHEGLEKSYRDQRDAYERIFNRLGVDYVIVSADAGAMGGSRSEEFLSPTPIGEDTFVRSVSGYAANVEAYTTPIPEPQDFGNVPTIQEIETPGITKIDDLVAFVNEHYPHTSGTWEASDMLKHVALTLMHLDGSRELVIIALPGDRDVDMKRAEALFAPAEIEAATPEDFSSHPDLVPGFLGPVTISSDAAKAEQLLGEETASKVRYFVDPRVVEGTSWVVGANREDTHNVFAVYGRDFTADAVADVANVLAGDPAPDGSGPVSLDRGIEIGHVFQLGQKYAEALGLKVLDENGRQVTVTMGSYGIGVTRLIAVIAEKYADDKGLRWPKIVSPYHLHIVATGKDDLPFEKANEIAEQLKDAGLDVLYDDRVKVSPGVKFRDAELLGMPYVLVVGKGIANNEVELWDRFSGERETMSLENGLLPQAVVDALR